MRDRSYHHGDLRAALLARAEETLREKGAEALSLRELARDLGVSHAAPSRHFRDRRALLDAVALNGFEQLTGLLTAADPGPAQGTFPERLTAQARVCVDFALRETELMGVMFSRKYDTPDSEPCDEIHAAWMRLGAPVFSVIADGQVSGDVRAGDVQRLALSVFIAVHGVTSMTAIGLLRGDEVESALEDEISILVQGLKPVPRDEV